MDSKKINAFLTAIELGSLTAAADRLGYTQSGLTHMMTSLEQELGLGLLIRGKSGVRPTPAAVKLLPLMKSFVHASDKLGSEADRLCRQNVSTLRIGAYSSIARQWLHSVISEYRSMCPDVQIQVSSGSVSELYTAVTGNDLDCAFVSYQPELCSRLEWLPLWDDELVAVVPADSELRDRCPVEHFTGRDFLMPALGFDMDITPALCTSGGKKIEPLSRSTNMDDAAIVSMVEHGLGETILSRLVMAGVTGNVKCLSLEPPAFRRLCLIYPKRLSGERSFRRFISAARSAVGNAEQGCVGISPDAGEI